jgi:hypothetical protein
MPLWYDKRRGVYRYIWRENGRQKMKTLGKDRKAGQIKARDLDHMRVLGELAPSLVRTTVHEHLERFINYHISQKRKANGGH